MPFQGPAIAEAQAKKSIAARGTAHADIALDAAGYLKKTVQEEAASEKRGVDHADIALDAAGYLAKTVQEEKAKRGVAHADIALDAIGYLAKTVQEEKAVDAQASTKDDARVERLGTDSYFSPKVYGAHLSSA